ncbi:NTP transferase domain-containing protein [Halobellus sp. GM3]|uniref:NTP transferase domain-containing protein n=1 Tax=Halobellus sp. GM3 TaxID=3458410 RepID=UPI00403E2CBC
MHGVILAAGEGSRMGEQTIDVPKAFMEIQGKTLYNRQRAVLEPYVDELTVVLGYQHETVLERFGPSRRVIVDRWDEYDNAESLYRALEHVRDDDLFVLNGDVVVTARAVDAVYERHRSVGENVVAYVPGIQSEHTAVRLDGDGRVTAYGKLPGHRHAGLGIIDRTYADEAASFLRENRREWYPSLYQVVPTTGVPISPEDHLEINRPQDHRIAQQRLPLS